ncbi:DNA-(apurinic or apyrimidinic site) lyase 1 [Hanseniaspora uvarum DSM 2768]|nr:DNA-(apurinic or apyrimidinic site) lyase 1 [Hanseniaspora uvarum DSM 2768]
MSTNPKFWRLKNSKYLFGAHVSAAGGISKSVDNARNIGCNSFALFLKSPRKWESKPYTQEEIDLFKEKCKKFNYDPRKHILPHGQYFINLANPEKEKAEKSYASFLDDLQRCESLDIGLYNFHPGSSLKGDHETQLKQLASYINKAIKETSFVKVVLENMAGTGNLVGSDLKDLKYVIDLIEDKSRVGVCIDTCHTFAAGYDLVDKSYDEFWKTFEDVIGFEYLSAIHLNDSKTPLGANRDLHEKLGQGFIGLNFLKRLTSSDFLENIPIILETPILKNDEEYGEEIKLLEWIAYENPSDDEFDKKVIKLQEAGAKSRSDQIEALEKKTKKSATASKKKAKSEGENPKPLKKAKKV